MTDIAHRLSISTSTVIRKLNEFKFETNWQKLPEVMSWDEYSFKKGKMSFIAQNFDTNEVLTILDGRTQAVIRNHFLRYPRQVRMRVKVMTMDMFSPYYQLAKQLFPNAQIVLDCFHIIQHLSRAMNRVRIQIMNQFDRKSQEHRALKRYWKLLQQDIRKLSHKRFLSANSLTMSKWKSEVTALKKEKDSLYSQIIDLRKEVEQAESVRSCIEQLQQKCRELSQVKKQELDL